MSVVGFTILFNIVLYQPEIPPNTGNIMRLCANTGCRLHLIEPLGFSLEDKQLRRAGLDYEVPHQTKIYSSIEEYFKKEPLSMNIDLESIRNNLKSELNSNPMHHLGLNLDLIDLNKDSSLSSPKPIVYLCSTKANRNYATVTYKPGDSFIFGPETRGLPQDILQAFPDDQKIKIPMKAPSRSLNLANAVAVIVYEAWRQQGFISE